MSPHVSACSLGLLVYKESKISDENLLNKSFESSLILQRFLHIKTSAFSLILSRRFFSNVIASRNIVSFVTVFVEFIFNAFTTTSERATHRQLNNSSFAVVGVEIFLKKIKSDVF
jgi:hypothetical protein